MNISSLKRHPDQCGFVDFIQNLQTNSHLGRKRLLSQEWISDPTEIERELGNMQSIEVAFLPENKRQTGALCMLISEVKDIERTLNNLSGSEILNEIELFEIKSFSFIAKKVFEVWQEFVVSNNLEIVGLDIISSDIFDEIVSILDPEKTGIQTFYIYDSYDAHLSQLRKSLDGEESAERIADTQAEILKIEDRVKDMLSNRLRVYCDSLFKSLKTISYIDLLLSKMAFASTFGLKRPKVSDSGTVLEGMFNPIEKQALKNRGLDYQPTNISFGRFPTLITGINMGGKTLTIKTIGLCQMLMQYGFFVPATNASIELVDSVLVSFHAETLQEEGLSSFASEMSCISDIIHSIQVGANSLILIDELARTTNPKEGRAIVEAMLDILQRYEVKAFITTHYDIETSCRRLRVRGIKEELLRQKTYTEKSLRKFIDYSLVEDTIAQTPNEAIRIAEMLGVSPLLIEKAKNRLK